MRILRSVASMALAGMAGMAGAESGLKVDTVTGFWAGTQTQLFVRAVRLDDVGLRMGAQAAAGTATRTPVAASVGGDYYFRPFFGDDTQARSGFRASSALLIRQPGISLSDLTLSSRSTAKYGLPLPPSLALGGTDTSLYNVSTMPYLGVGYSEFSLKSGWGFWADIGLVVQSPGNVAGVGRVLSGTQGVEELMRELRMAPMMQFGVNYSF